MTEPMFSAEQRELLARTILREVKSEDERRLFIETCERTRLDPFQRQIFPVIRREKVGRGSDDHWVDRMTIQVSIDGFRLVAQRTGEYAGQVGPHWCGPDGQWRDVWLAPEPPVAARVGVYRRGFVEALFAVARFDAYAQTRTVKTDGGRQKLVHAGLWARMPDLMIGKCAEALALRRAFPAELSGLYTSDEMAQAENPPAAAPLEPRTQERPAAAPPPPVDDDAFASAIAGEPTASAAIQALEHVNTDDRFLAWAGVYVPILGTLPKAEKARLWRAMVATAKTIGLEEGDVRAIVDETQARARSSAA